VEEGVELGSGSEIPSSVLGAPFCPSNYFH
jgi:hypothetical protein